jgi:DNA-binding NarL/FixJ family response regulator
VVSHRQEWFSGNMVGGLRAGGVAVVAELQNGADALGVVVAEQPDVLLVEDEVPMVSGLELTEAAARYAPSTLVVVQVEHDWDIGPFLDAGATTVCTRRTPPARILADLLAALTG